MCIKSSTALYLELLKMRNIRMIYDKFNDNIL
jgi:hypothetical protein